MNMKHTSRVVISVLLLLAVGVSGYLWYQIGELPGDANWVMEATEMRIDGIQKPISGLALATILDQFKSAERKDAFLLGPAYKGTLRIRGQEYRFELFMEKEVGKTPYMVVNKKWRKIMLSGPREPGFWNVLRSFQHPDEIEQAAAENRSKRHT